MEQGPSWKAYIPPTSHGIPCILWNRRVHYCVHKSPPVVTVVSQINPSHPVHPVYLRSILLSSHLCLCLPSDLFPSVFSTKTLYVFLFPFTCAISLSLYMCHVLHPRPSCSPVNTVSHHTRVGTLIVATIYLQLIQNRYMFRSFTVLQCSHQRCVQPVASDVEVVGYL